MYQFSSVITGCEAWEQRWHQILFLLHSLLPAPVFPSLSLILSVPPSWHPSLLSHFHHLLSSLCFSASDAHFSPPLLFILALRSLRPKTSLVAMRVKTKACATSPTAASSHLAPTKLICFFGRPWGISELTIIFCRGECFPLPLRRGGQSSRRLSSVIRCLRRKKMCKVRCVQGRLWTPAATRGGDCKHSCTKEKKKSNSSCHYKSIKGLLFTIRWQTSSQHFERLHMN